MRLVLSASLVALLGCRAEPTDPKEDTDPVELTDGDGDGHDVETDCDDADPATYPDAAELCDGADNDCDGEIDEDAGGATLWYTDADGDGYGDAAGVVEACEAPAGTVAVADDCDDADAAFHPGADESDCADPNDYNCDGSVGFADADGDGFAACQECDDASATTNPSATEVCNEIDDDCDALVDDADDSRDASTAATWYTDADADTYGNAASAVLACAQPEGTVADATDCDDAAGAVNPGAPEVCNDLDDDCDTLVDDADDSRDASTAATWYSDGDGDGYAGAGTTTLACDQPEGTFSEATDCDDAQAAINPGATEVCNEQDDDCDGAVDDADSSLDTTSAGTWYTDADRDAYGNPDATTRACVQPPDTSASAGDCDDASAAVNPAATEVCNDLDDDCDALVDDADTSLDASTAGTWYADTDGDGFGDAAASTLACDQPAGTLADATDCDDDRAAVNPDATEVCNDLDDDCDALVDDADASLDTSTGSTWYADLDEDGYGDAGAPALACDRPADHVAGDADCDDTETSVHPGAAEACNAVDDDCDGSADDGVLGSGEECAASSCASILDGGSADGDGTYYLEGISGSVFPAYCDMTTDGGGWTLVGSVVNDIYTTGSHIRKWNSYAAWTDETTFGSIGARQTADYKSPAYSDVAGYDVLVVTDEYTFAFENVVGAQPFADHIASEYDSGTCGTNFLASGADYYEGLTAAQASAFSWVIRPHDDNATCFPTGNEAAMIGIQLTECCWTPGMGNTPSGYPSWDDYDLSLLKASRLTVQTCTAGDYPCNDNGRQFTNTSSDYTYTSKVVYAETYVR